MALFVLKVMPLPTVSGCISVMIRMVGGLSIHSGWASTQVQRAHAAEVSELHCAVESVGVIAVHRFGVGAYGRQMEVRTGSPVFQKVLIVYHGIIACKFGYSYRVTMLNYGCNILSVNTLSIQYKGMMKQY